MADTLDSKAVWDPSAVAIALVWLVTAPVAVTFGNPPGWLLAQDVRGTSDNLYLGYTGKKWDKDFGVANGRCDTQALNAAISRQGAQTRAYEGRQVATITGPVASGMDQKDRACVGHALELAGIERVVAWTNDESGARYRVIPLGGYVDRGMSCREFVTRITNGSRDETGRYRACSSGDGAWQIAG
jgi:surface antigen